MSALEQNVDNDIVWKQGVIDFISKPFDWDILIAKINNQLKIRKEFRQHLLDNNNWLTPDSDKVIQSIDEVFLKDMIQCINKNLVDAELDVNSLSNMLNISRSTLYNKVKALTGHSPSIFIRKHRLSIAKSLLQKKAGNVTEVAFQVGYTNMSLFSRQFKE